MSVSLLLNRNKSVQNIILSYDIPGKTHNLKSLSVEEMERRLVASYGMPDILRTESPYQHITYNPKDLICGSNNCERSSKDWGTDQWSFTKGESIDFGPGYAHQDAPGEWPIEQEVISFNSTPGSVLLTMPARHPIPVILTKMYQQPENGSWWRSGEQITIRLSLGGDSTCVLAQPPPSSVQSDVSQRNFITCTEFAQIPVSSVQTVPKATFMILKGGRKLATGYIVDPKK